MALFSGEAKFNKEFLAVSKETGVPVSLLKGLAAAESAFNPSAMRSEPHIRDASRGLLQILERTAKGVGFQGDPAQLFTPVVGLRYGAKYLRELLERYPDVTQAIASYNMGSPRPARDNKSGSILRKLYPNPDATWVYANQPYVDKVAAYVAYYQTFDQGDTPDALARRARIVDLIKKKDYATPRALLKNPFLLSREAVPA